VAESALLAIAFASAALGCAELASIDPWMASSASATGNGGGGGAGTAGQVASGSGAAASASGGGGGKGGAAPSYYSSVLADLPLGYWRLGEKSGTTAVNEIVGVDGMYEFPGLTLGEPGAIAGDDDTALACGGEGGRVVLNDSFDVAPNQPFSIELWAKPLAIDLTYRFLISKRSEGIYEGYALFVQVEDGLQWVRYGGGRIESSLVVSEPLAENVFSHVVVTSDGTDMSLYVNGMLEALGTPSALSDTDSRFVIGANDARPSSNEFLGWLDEVAVYDHALSEQRVEAHYQAALGR
jgi:hypothetical protein